MVPCKRWMDRSRANLHHACMLLYVTQKRIVTYGVGAADAVFRSLGTSSGIPTSSARLYSNLWRIPISLACKRVYIQRHPCRIPIFEHALVYAVIVVFRSPIIFLQDLDLFSWPIRIADRRWIGKNMQGKDSYCWLLTSYLTFTVLEYLLTQPPPYLLFSCAFPRWSPMFMSAYAKMAPSQCPNRRRLCCLCSSVPARTPLWSTAVTSMTTSSRYCSLHAAGVSIVKIWTLNMYSGWSLSAHTSSLRSICSIGNKPLLLYFKVLKDFYWSKFHN
jgi:hypothetical protein